MGMSGIEQVSSVRFTFYLFAKKKTLIFDIVKRSLPNSFIRYRIEHLSVEAVLKFFMSTSAR